MRRRRMRRMRRPWWRAVVDVECGFGLYVELELVEYEGRVFGVDKRLKVARRNFSAKGSAASIDVSYSGGLNGDQRAASVL
jgi:hypothetical protein